MAVKTRYEHWVEFYSGKTTCDLYVVLVEVLREEIKRQTEAIEDNAVKTAILDILKIRENKQ